MSDKETKRNLPRVEAWVSEDVINAARAEAAKAKKAASNLADPFLDRYDKLGIAEPPISFTWLASTYTESGPLQDNIGVMARNIGGFGIDLETIGPKRKDMDKETLELEKAEIISQIDGISGDTNLAQLREMQRVDLETFGNSFLEVLRGSGDEVEGLGHAPTFTIRIAGKRSDPIEAVKYVQHPRHGWLKVKYLRRRYLFAQLPWGTLGGSGEVVYFKEFGDTRVIDAETGKVDKETTNPATELIWRKHYHPSYAYGVPRWIGRNTAVLSHIKAGDTNFVSLARNLMPRIIISMLNSTADDKEKKAINNAYQAWCSKSNVTAPLILTLAGADGGADPYGKTEGGAKLQIDQFKDQIGEDALFLKGMKFWEDDLRSAWGFGPIYTGRNQDLNYASAEASINLAETNVFDPARQDEDWMLNQILASMGVTSWRIVTNGATISNPENVIKLIQELIKGGGTINEVRIAMREHLAIEMPEFPQAWGRFPLIFVQAAISKGDIKIVDGDGEDDDMELTQASEGAEKDMDEFRANRLANETLPEFWARMALETAKELERLEGNDITPRGHHGDEE